MLKKDFIDNQKEQTTKAVSAESRGRNPRFGRREYLQLAGTTLTSLGALGGVGLTAAARDYEVITVPAGERYVRRVGTGESFENKLVDVSARGAEFRLIASGRDWVVRNVGIEGRIDSSDHSNMFNLRVADGGSALVENVYLGDGAVPGAYAPFFVPTAHAGTLTLRRIHVRHWPNNGLYASAPGRDDRDGQNGVVRIEESYARNNNIDGFRLGTDGSVVRNSVVHVDARPPGVFGGKHNGRGIWVKEGGDVTIENCDVLIEHPDGGVGVLEKDGSATGVARVIDSEVAVRNGTKPRFRGNVRTKNVGSNPDVSPPSGVPMSAEEAASGGDGGSSLPHHLEITGTGELVPYEFTVSGDLEPGSEFDTDGTDGISGSTGTGRVNNTGTDDFYFSGRLSDFSADGDLEVYVDSEQVNPDALFGRELLISNRAYDEPATYDFAVSEDLRATDSVNTTDGDEISGTSASGRVNGGSDAYRFADDLEYFSHDGPLDLTIDGEQVNPEQFARLDNHLRVQATGERANYEFSVSGDLEAGPEFDTDGTDGISGSTGTGTIGGTSDDDFYFDGQLERFEHDGALELYVNDEQVNPDTIGRPENHLRIQATGERSNYRFAVSGDLAPGSEFDTDGTDGIDGSVGSGTITGTSDDDFYFDGKLERFDYDAPLELYLNGEQIDPDGFGLSRTLSIVGNGTGAAYEFTVSGALEKSTARDGTINAGDEISGSTASGIVGGGTDSYTFDGDLTDFDVDDSDAVTVYLDGQEMDLGRFALPHEITISNRGFSEPATYQFTVSGDLGATTSLNPGDEISGTSASGRVNGGADTYRYSGTVTAFSNDGPVDVSLDGKTVKSGE